MIENSFTQNDYLILKREVMYDGFFRMIRYTLRYKLFGGGFSETIIRELMERKSAIAVLPYDPVRDQVVLIEQFRPGATLHPKSPWLIEIIAGTLEENESPKEVVYREAMEEGNCKILDLLPIYEYFVSPGGSNEQLALFCGRVDAQNVDGIHGLQTEHEDIRTFTVAFEEAITLMQQGVIQVSPAIISLQWLQLNRTWLRELWQK